MTSVTRTFLLLMLLTAPLLGGCKFPQEAPRITDEQVWQRWLSSIADGRTKRDDVQQLLGEPAFRYSNDHIRGYRLILSERSTEPSNEEYLREWDNRSWDVMNARRLRLPEGGTLLSIRDVHEESLRKLILLRDSEFGLLLFFDADGVLSQHTFTRIRYD
jgi:hypothetical protein